MKIYASKKILVITAIFFVMLLLTGFGFRRSGFTPAAQTGCSLTSAEFNSWFTLGSASLNGIVKPFVSDSFPKKFPEPSNCVFFKWSERTFLWLTSPVPGETAPVTDRIFTSNAFYDVSPPGADGKRTLSQHEPGKMKLSGIRDSKVGPNFLPVTFEKGTGRMLEIETGPVSSRGLPLISNKNGVQTEVANIRFDKAKKPVFLDKTGGIIESPKPLAPKRPYAKSTIVNKYIVAGKLVYLDGGGKVIDVVETQADGGVLMSQNNSLVYYSIMVNQQYAYFHSNERSGEIDGSWNFFGRGPEKVAAYALAHGKTILYPENSLMEIKCSWVEASTVQHPEKYIILKASIPTYNKSATEWVPNGQKTVDMALVGMHVVADVKWHSSMLWATFEHVDNAPNATYAYFPTQTLKDLQPVNSSKPRPQLPSDQAIFQTVQQNTSGSWLFCANGSSGPFNVPRMYANDGKIVANSGKTIGPSDIIRWKPWGSGSPTINTEIKELNSRIMGLLSPHDVRKNYFLVGTTWLVNVNNEEVVRGSIKLANSTMETYLQGTSNSTTTGTNCFSCHRVSSSPDYDPDLKTLSHIYFSLKPLIQ